MDTRVWGPDLWPLLHLICQRYDSSDAFIKAIMPTFLEAIPYVLPCIYCRRSFAQYLKELPLTEHELNSCGALSKWMYLMHNKVNDKLRKQGLIQTEDPTYEEIYEKYERMAKEINTSFCTRMSGWKALYAIATVYPKGGVQNIECNRWSGYFTFFTFLPYVIPFPELRTIMVRYSKGHPLVPMLARGRDHLQKWLYGLEKQVASEVHDTCTSFEERCAEAERIRAGCGSKRDKIPTCRQGVNIPMTQNKG